MYLIVDNTRVQSVIERLEQDNYKFYRVQRLQLSEQSKIELVEMPGINYEITTYFGTQRIEIINVNKERYITAIPLKWIKKIIVS